MLKPSKKSYQDICYVPLPNGMGDFISIIQYCHHTNKKIISHYSPSGRLMIKEILSLFTNDITLVQSYKRYLPVQPHWHYVDCLSYVKSKFIRDIQKDNFVVIALTPNSSTLPENGIDRTLNRDNIKKILELLGSQQIINLSSYGIVNLDNITNCGSYSIFNKLHKLSVASINICVDTGIAHLAAMTDTPTIVIAPPLATNRYCGNKNIHFVSNIEDLITKYNQLLVK